MAVEGDISNSQFNIISVILDREMALGRVGSLSIDLSKESARVE
ncbi:hypothetical protein [Methylicorpusculum sp.]|nr:hypothetical protein [Methylicorpusculum sp.]MDO9238370.1 hypothetical protein [Methylicorpusculum sp.]MDP2179740.1 hypothetical protein [Methylicorpusculum sp.]MDP3529860.1 hypothetical protein [Methylicorpusculum sp.]